jgi:chaperone required for assembly of F1-ATPase
VPSIANETCSLKAEPELLASKCIGTEEMPAATVVFRRIDLYKICRRQKPIEAVVLLTLGDYRGPEI